MRVPRTVVTSDGEQAHAFAREIGRPVVYKSMSTGVVADQDTLKIVYTGVSTPPISTTMPRSGCART